MSDTDESASSKTGKKDRHAADLDAATLRSLSLLTTGQPLDFVDIDSPPRWADRWLRRANLRQVQGLLVQTLRRWHELRFAKK